jgi:nitroreductase
MDVLEAIYCRQSVSGVNSDPVPREIIEKLLAAAVQAPNHYHSRPWRFAVFSGDGRRRLGEALAQALRRHAPAIDEAVVTAQRMKPLRASAAIVIGVDAPDRPHVHEIENICAVACATQNLLLAAHALGLATIWKTVDHEADPVLREALGLVGVQHILGVIYIGYPLNELCVPMRPNFLDRTKWNE